MKARSSALHPLVVAIVWTLAFLVVAVIVKAPDFVLWAVIGLLGLEGIGLLGGFIFFAICCPDNLRSERFALRREEISRLGDSKTGLSENPPTKAVSDSSVRLLEGRQK